MKQIQVQIFQLLPAIQAALSGLSFLRGASVFSEDFLIPNLSYKLVCPYNHEISFIGETASSPKYAAAMGFQLYLQLPAIASDGIMSFMGV